MVRGNALLDPHPVDLLRVYLAMGATSALKGLAPATRQSWITLLTSIAKEAAGRARSIDVFDVDQQAVVQRLPLTAMANTAQAVGAYIATAQLSSLDNHSVQDIETWDDADDATATAIRKAAGSGTSIVALGDDAQLLAGTTMALYDDATQYAGITTALNAALDDSFARDPFFGIAAPHFMFARAGRTARGRSNRRTPTFSLLLE